VHTHITIYTIYSYSECKLPTTVTNSEYIYSHIYSYIYICIYIHVQFFGRGPRDLRELRACGRKSIAPALHIVHFGTFGRDLRELRSFGRAGASEVLSLGFQPLSRIKRALPFPNMSSRSRFGTSVALPLEFQHLSLKKPVLPLGFRRRT